MSVRKTFLAASSAIAVWLWGAFAIGPMAAPQVPYPRTFKDATGHVVTVKAKPARIASVVLGVDENLLDLVDPSRIVAMTEISHAPYVSNVADRIPKGPVFIRDQWQRVVDARPDLVLTATYTRELGDPLIARKVPVYEFSEFRSVDALLKNFEILGQLVGEEAKARAVLAKDRAMLAEARKKPWPKPIRAVYYSEGNVYAAGTVPSEIITLAGLVDAATASGLKEYITATPALVEKLRPDIILFGEDSAEAEQKTAAMFRTPAYQKIAAVKAGRLYAIPGRHITTTSHHIVKAVADVQALVD